MCAFGDCRGLETVTIPKKVSYMGSYVFFYCKELKIYCEAKEKPERWREKWGETVKEIVWGVENSD